MRIIDVPIISLSALVFISCGQNRKSEDGEKNAVQEHEHAEPITLTDRQLQAVNIQLGEVEQRDLNNIVRTNGEINLDPQYKAEINSLTGGIIRQILVTEGNHVSNGQAVAYLENTEILEMQKNYLIIRKEALIAEQEYNRQKELFGQDAGVEKTFQQAMANYEIAQARLTGLKKQLQQFSINPEQVSGGNIVTQIPVKSPICGTVHKITICIGSYANAQIPLMSINDNSHIHCDLKVFEKDIHLIQLGQEVDITLTNQPGTSLKGVIYEMNKSFENDTKAILVHVRIVGVKKNSYLLPGMYVTALINTGKQKTAAVPNDAIVSSDGKKYLFLLEDEATNEEGKSFHFRRVEVITGISELGFTQITPMDDLPENTKIVTSNAFYIASMLAGSEENHQCL
jgi:cobalt-zinc-cadmium efflux system membrane fusion protein